VRVLGIDPGVQKMGLGIVDDCNGKLVAVFFETFKTKSSLSRYEKFRLIFEHVQQVIREFQPTVVALEDIFFGRNFKVAIRLGEARSLSILAAVLADLKVSEYLPTRVKEAICGNGRASKRQVQHMVMRLLQIVELPEEDAADALAVAICHFQSRKFL